jgi:hypothetical protein
MHGYLKTVLMMLVSSGIDAMVTTFRQIGVFNKKDSIEAQSETSDNKIISDFINDIKKIVREK